MKRILALSLAVLTMVSLTACDGSSEDSGTSSPADTSAIATQTGEQSTAVTIGYVGTHDSSYPSSSISNDFISQRMIYDKLFEVDDITGEYTSRVLESWGWESDHVTFQMKLKDGITFSDGTKMTGEDVLFSLQNYMNNGNTTDKYPYMQYIDFDKSYVDTDGLTIYVVYKQEYGPAEGTLDACIMEQAFTGQHPENDDIWYTGPVGSGPYQVSECVKDSYVTYTLRDDYWNRDYTYDATQITLKYYTDRTAMYADYQSGILDCIYDISANIVDQIEQADNQGTVATVSNNDVTFLMLNENNQYLRNVKVREAIAYALDMQAISDMAYGSLATTAKSHFASTFDCYSEHEGYPYDVEKAKQTLKDAGYSEGQITLKFIAVNMDPQPIIAEAVQGYLQAIGINVQVSSLELGTALPAYINGEADMCCFSVNGGNPTREPYQTVSAIDETATFTSMRISDATFNEYLRDGLNHVDKEIRKESYRKADQWLYDNYMALPICETLSALAYNSRIASFDQSAITKSCLGSLTLAG